jgi:hypothetical protein
MRSDPDGTRHLIPCSSCRPIRTWWRPERTPFLDMARQRAVVWSLIEQAVFNCHSTERTATGKPVSAACQPVVSILLFLPRGTLA